MLTINIVAWALLIAMPTYGLYAGSGNLFFTAVFIGISGLLVKLLGVLASNILDGSAGVIGLCQLIIFFALCVASFPLGSMANRLLLITFDPFDFVLGFIFGAVAAVFAVHFLLEFLLTTYTGSSLHITLVHCYAVRQFVYFDWWHHLTASVVNLTDDKRPLSAPD